MPGILVGYYRRLNGRPATGSVTIEPSTADDLVRDSAGAVLFAGATRVTLTAMTVTMPVDATDPDSPTEDVTVGGFVVKVPGWDESGVEPQGVTYTVTAKVNGLSLDPVVGVRVGDGQVVNVVEAMSIDPDAPVYAVQVTRAEFDELAGRVADERFPEGTTLPLRADWQPAWWWFRLVDSVTGEQIDLYDKEGLPA